MAGTNEAVSASDSSAVAMRLSAVLQKVPLDKAKLANVPSGSNMPREIVAGQVTPDDVAVAAGREGGVHNCDVVGMEGWIGFFAGVGASFSRAMKHIVRPFVDQTASMQYLLNTSSRAGSQQLSSHILLLLMKGSKVIAIVILQRISHGIDAVLQGSHPF